MNKFLSLAMLICMGCENLIDFDSDQLPPKMVVNTLIDSTSDSHIIEISEAESVFQEWSGQDIFDTAPPQLKVNGTSISLSDEIDQSDSGGIWAVEYSFDYPFRVGDRIELSHNSDRYGNINATETIPLAAEIKDVRVIPFEEGGNSYINTLLTIKDIPNEDNYYRVVIYCGNDDDRIEEELGGFGSSGWDGWITPKIFTERESLFKKIPIALEDDFPRFQIFSDASFKDKEYTLDLYVKKQFHPNSGESIFLKVELQTIPASLYKYLRTLEISAEQDYTMELVKIFSNIDGGYGILGVYNKSQKMVPLEK